MYLCKVHIYLSVYTIIGSNWFSLGLLIPFLQKK